MQVYDLIQKTVRQEKLMKSEMQFLITNFTNNKIPDYMMSAWLMAVRCQGLSPEETADMTLAMRDSGEILDFSEIPGVTVDKHSTGGIGDKTTLMIAPIVAACGGYVPKMSGRGLGFTGGTIDKLEGIPGFSVNLSRQDFYRQIQKIGCAVIAQSGNLTPADKKIYALRNLTATVDSIPLISASIMSKKLALNADCILLDVKCGNGAFMKTRESALALAESMKSTAIAHGKKCSAVITDMNAPLGMAVGNALEVREAISILRCEIHNPLAELVIDLSGQMLALSGMGDLQECRCKALKALESGKALTKFAEMIAAQGGDASVTDHPEKLPHSRASRILFSDRSGYLASVHSEEVGLACLELGAGRTSANSQIDPGAGVVFLHQIGDEIQDGDVLCEIHADSDVLCEQAEKRIRSAIQITEMPVPELQLIDCVI
ncbi:MAG: thymidine phosphorylase [Oscillospiraceae bacterium]|nr:thymidine phosphorylase [Oscillospiraceae bacterium]